jgi:hypothetical protein
MNANGIENRKVNWREVGLLCRAHDSCFLGHQPDPGIDSRLWTNSGTINSLQMQMLIPAFSAIVLGMFVFKNSPLYFRTNQSATRWFFYAFMLFTLMFVGFHDRDRAPEAMAVY